MEENVDFENQSENENPRPTFLKVLCILSYVFIGLSLLFGLMSMLGGPMNEEQMLNNKVELYKRIDEMRQMNMTGFAEMFEKIQRMTEAMNANFYAVSAVPLSVMSLGLFSVIRMWNGYKTGFHLYIAYSLLSVIQIYFFVSPNDVPTFVIVWNLIFSALFVFLYSRNLKWMTK